MRFIVTLMTLLFFSACHKVSGDSAFWALLAMNNACVINGQVFQIDGDIVCTANGAQGTGTLTALTDHGKDLAVELHFTLAAGGNLELLAAASPSYTPIRPGFGFRIKADGPAEAIWPDGEAVAIGTLSAGIDPVVYCIEMHRDEDPVHGVLDNAACPTSLRAVADAYYDTTRNLPISHGAQGSRWGLVLNKVTITELRIFGTASALPRYVGLLHRMKHVWRSLFDHNEQAELALGL